MTRQNPIMDIINQGGAGASASMSQAARTAGIAGQSFNRGASLALKVDQMLENREAELANRFNQSQKTMNNILNTQLNAAFKERQAKMDALKFAENQRQFGITSELQEDRVDIAKQGLGLQNQRLDIANKQYDLSADQFNWKKQQKEKELKLEQDALNSVVKTLGGGTAVNGGGKAYGTVTNEQATGNLDQYITHNQDLLSKATTAEEKQKAQTNIDYLTKLKTKTSNSAPNNLVSVGGNNQTPQERRKSILDEINRVRSETAVAGKLNPKAKALADARIKGLESEYKLVGLDDSTASEMIYGELKSKPNMKEQEFSKYIGEYIRKNHFSDKDKKIMTSTAKDIYKQHQEKLKERRTEYGKLTAKNESRSGSDEYYVNDSVAKLAAAYPQLQGIVEEGFENQASSSGLIFQENVFEYGPLGLTDDEARASSFINGVANIPELKFLLTGVTGDMNEDQKYNKLISNLKSKDYRSKISEVTGIKSK